MSGPRSSQPDALPDDVLDDLREHFVNGSGAFTDSAMVGRLIIEIDRLRALFAESTETPTLDLARLKQAVTNIAVRHQVVKDPPPPNWSLMSLYGYSAAPADMDAEIAAEYARLRPDEPPLTNANGDEPQYTDDQEYDGPLPRDGRVAP